MLNDIRIYNYNDDQPLISRTVQIQEYLDKKFADIQVDVDLSEVENKIDNVNDNITTINNNISDKINGSTVEIKAAIEESTTTITEAIEESSPCLCHMATKEDISNAKTEIISKIDENKDLIIKEIDDKFVDLNELVK